MTKEGGGGNRLKERADASGKREREREGQKWTIEKKEVFVKLYLRDRYKGRSTEKRNES